MNDRFNNLSSVTIAKSVAHCHEVNTHTHKENRRNNKNIIEFTPHEQNHEYCEKKKEKFHIVHHNRLDVEQYSSGDMNGRKSSAVTVSQR